MTQKAARQLSCMPMQVSAPDELIRQKRGLNPFAGCMSQRMRSNFAQILAGSMVGGINLQQQLVLSRLQ
eukprot:CAMPEP_0202923180 /NCGR_PEP_ID=MMETSP1392-20130828/78317_1 /ASSEMBLY_ACC=CAM_ASM_000868 /TAXON_ID=225041 /ORGANISM="Chlamydomonas chlamydogama, Strain SAG 11-48b" /LENGTH=68 /DNA_ID=CAMNT_0049616853 /DNA_START=620 /DNA_END=823 /DNA_ORIENTATION=+